MKLGKSFINDIRELIRSARATVARGVDLVQVHTNFEIGRRIFEQEQKGRNRAAYGKQVVKALAEQLTAEFGSGFSKRNLDYFRRFYLEYANRQAKIVQTMSAQLVSDENSRTLPDPSHVFRTLSGEVQAGRSVQTAYGQLAHPSPFSARPFTLSWSHYVFLLGVKNPDERSFYEIEATRQGWTLRELKRQFDSSLYERLALSRDKKGIRQLARKGQIVNRPQDLLKEPFVLEFLGLDEKHRYSESDLESAIISQIERFLLELGKGFLFEARQKRFTFDEEHFFVDLVFYNRLLRCYVLIDLKIGKLTHQDLGQMQMYVNYFDREVKRAGEKSTVGIILCKQKNKALVEITLPKGAHIHAKEYQLYLPSKAELRQKLDEWAREAEDE
jgi:predicted nuclease of restriction endonuclease-like (RecB) superfamily